VEFAQLHPTRNNICPNAVICGFKVRALLPFELQSRRRMLPSPRFLSEVSRREEGKGRRQSPIERRSLMHILLITASPPLPPMGSMYCTVALPRRRGGKLSYDDANQWHTNVNVVPQNILVSSCRRFSFARFLAIREAPSPKSLTVAQPPEISAQRALGLADLDWGMSHSAALGVAGPIAERHF
jgi:hypothetical protein